MKRILNRISKPLNITDLLTSLVSSSLTTTPNKKRETRTNSLSQKMSFSEGVTAITLNQRPNPVPVVTSQRLSAKKMKQPHWTSKKV